MVGEIVVRPHMLLGTDALIGEGLGNLVSGHDIAKMLERGEAIIGDRDVTGDLHQRERWLSFVLALSCLLRCRLSAEYAYLPNAGDHGQHTAN
jgi:hypothetical protein